MSSRLYSRMRQVACRYWSVAPPQLDTWIEEGRVSMLDITELVFMLAHDPITVIWLIDYLYPEEKARQNAQKARQEADEKQRRTAEQHHRTMLMMLNMCKPKNDDDAARIAAMKEALAK